MVDGSGEEHHAEGGAQLLHQAHPVLQLEAERREVLDEGGAVDELDRRADAVRGGQGLDDHVVVALADMRGDQVLLGLGLPRRVEMEGLEDLLGHARLELLGDRVEAEGEAVDPILHPDAVLLRLELDVGGPLARGQGEDVLDDPLGAALLPDRAGRERHPVRIGERVHALGSQRGVDVLPANVPSAHEDLAEARGGGLLLYERLEQLGRAQLAHADEDVAQTVAALVEGVQLFLEPGGRLAPELVLVGVGRLAETMEAEGAELGGALGVVRAPHGVEGVELAQAVPAGRQVGLERQ